MMAVVTENVPARLRGRLAVWLVEIRAGVYLGQYSKRVREHIQEEIARDIGAGNAVIAWTAPTETGYDFATIGHNRRIPHDHDGLRLVRFTAEQVQPQA